MLYGKSTQRHAQGSDHLFNQKMTSPLGYPKDGLSGLNNYNIQFNKR
jgi:hypothetical protein